MTQRERDVLLMLHDGWTITHYSGQVGTGLWTLRAHARSPAASVPHGFVGLRTLAALRDRVLINSTDNNDHRTYALTSSGKRVATQLSKGLDPVRERAAHVSSAAHTTEVNA